jgi:2-oxo-4-hydroxy-4-carboxy-5-ureidoimidazoline decarboxylase
MIIQLARWNELPKAEATKELLVLCGSAAWASRVVEKRPFSSPDELITWADEVWSTLELDDWMEAFLAHPRIGTTSAPQAAPDSLALSHDEQRQVLDAGNERLSKLAEGNRAYEEQYGFRFIICASGRSADEILEALYRRLNRDRSVEVIEAAEQQRQITQLRMRKWLKL